ncbi:MAG: N-acetyl sugar amidotransferase [Bacteroidota bacterium]|nr:N-acetyl sugar amidotransferase [Bacteroidota bacterium]
MVVLNNSNVLSNYRQCKRCLMDTTDKEIQFDNQGYCNHCTEYLIQRSKSHIEPEDKRLFDLVSNVKKSGHGKKYDCVIGVSGGADGCYLAYVCKKLGLRSLLVHMDNGWNSNLAVENIKAVADNLGFDYESYVLDWEEFRDLQLSFFKASVPELETPTDIAILGSLHRVASKYGVKYVFMGGNYATEGILPKNWHYDPKDKRYLTSIQRQFGNVKLKKFPFFDYRLEFYYKLIKKIRIVYLLNYVPYSKEIGFNVLKSMGWREYVQKHHESLYTAFVQSYVLPIKFNIDYRKIILSIKVCNNLITREAAFEILQKKPYDDLKIEQEIDYICKKLNISLEEFNRIMQLPPKNYNNYENNQKFLEFIYKMYRKLKSKI